MSLNELNKFNNTVVKAAKAVFNNEKFLAAMLVKKANMLAQNYPQDHTVVGCYNILLKKAESQVWVTRGELNEIYNRHHTNNNKFAQSFKDELGLVDYNPVKRAQRDSKEGESFTDETYKKLGNTLLAEQLESVFDKDIPFRTYSVETESLAKKTCTSELNAIGVVPKKVSVAAGQEDIIFCQATYETPKGHSNVIIPLEIKNNKALSPNVFLSENGFVNLDRKSLQNHIITTAGRYFNVDLNKLLKKISDIKNGTSKPLSNVEKALLKVESTRQEPTFDSNSILMQEVDPVNHDLKTPKLKLPNELQLISDNLISNTGSAEFIFGKKAVNLGKGLILNELKQAGFIHPQVAVSNNTSNSIEYAVSIGGKFGFNIPVKIKDGNPKLPNVIVANGRVFELSAKGISDLLNTGETNSRALAVNSPVYDCKPGQLVEMVRKAMSEQNFLAAEDALHVLKESKDGVAYSTAHAIYLEGLKGEVKETVTCKAQIKVASSQHLVCSHTMLPVHKTFVDKLGNCRPLYRKEMQDSSDGAVATITSKIYFD